MTNPLRSQTVLIVDEDLGFVFWLGQLLADLVHQTVPALSCHQAVVHLQYFNVNADAVFVNPALSGVSTLLQKLVRANTRLRIILIKTPHIDTPGTIRAHAILEKPSGWEEVSHQQWLQRVKKALTDQPPLASWAKTTGQ